MSPEALTTDFLRRAAAEAGRYGDDPWVFLRELGQNARDAGASRIEVRLARRDGLAVLAFVDDGRGMTLAHARRYLFRLYASSKETEIDSAGRFGVGFWSVLRFAPLRIEIHSRCREQAWAVALAGDLASWRRLDCRLATRGTSVVLVRDPGSAGFEALRDEVHRGLVRYLAHLRTAGRRPRPLPVRFDGHNIQRPFRLPGPGSLRFRDGPVEGVVGFGPRPAYRLLARGLPVVEGAFLDELEGQPSRPGPQRDREGVAPVYLLNGNHLEVVLSRQTVVRDRALTELLRVARLRFDELVSGTIDGSGARARLRRLLSGWLRGLIRTPAWLRWTTAAVCLLVLGGLAGLLLANGRPATGWTPTGPPPVAGPAPPAAGGPVGSAGQTAEPDPPPAVRSAAQRPGQWAGVRTGTVSAGRAEAGWDLAYSPPLPLLFRQHVLDRFEPALGWQVGAEQDGWRPAERLPAATGAVEVRLRLDGPAGVYLLPVPTGYRPQAGSARFRGRPVGLEVNDLGLTRVRIADPRPGRLRYELVPARRAESEPADRWRRVPPGPLPGPLESALAGLGGLPAAERPRAAKKLIQARLAYDRSAATARAYERGLGPGRDWSAEVLAIGAGDCDVLNGLLVLVLRRLGIPARLVAGIVGRDGRGLPGWHAWVELVDGDRIRVLDATAGARLMEPAPGPPGPAAALAPGRAAPRPTDRSFRGPVGAALAGLVLLLLGLAAWLGLRRGSELSVVGDEQRRRELLAGMAADALRRPAAWRDVYGIWHRSFLPCLGARAISLARLVRLSRADRALLGSAGNELSAMARKSGLEVLAADDAHFGPLYSRTANLRDLDELARLRPLGRSPGPAGGLLAELDRLCAAGRGGVLLRAVAGIRTGRPFRDVDLRPIRPPRRSVWPRRFVAVDPAHPWWRGLEALYRRAPGAALAVAADRLAGESRLLAPRAEVIRRRAARRALERP